MHVDQLAPPGFGPGQHPAQMLPPQHAGHAPSVGQTHGHPHPQGATQLPLHPGAPAPPVMLHRAPLYRTRLLQPVAPNLVHRPLDMGNALRNGAIGAAAGGALGGIGLLAKRSLPLIGKVVGLGGVARLAAIGGGVGLAAAVLPSLSSRSPVLGGAATGAAVGAVAGLVLPILSPVGGAVIGALAGAGIAAVKNRGFSSYASSYGGFPPPLVGAHMGAAMCRHPHPMAMGRPPMGMFPGAMPGQMPLPGMMPAGMPGQIGFRGMPGQMGYPGMVPGGMPGQMGHPMSPLAAGALGMHAGAQARPAMVAVPHAGRLGKVRRARRNRAAQAGGMHTHGGKRHAHRGRRNAHAAAHHAHRGARLNRLPSAAPAAMSPAAMGARRLPGSMLPMEAQGMQMPPTPSFLA